jgi:uncharacterized protein YidB (DUF937 family)
MSLLGSILGSVLGGGQQQANPLLNIVLGMLSNGSQQGGLGGLMGQFQKAGLGNVMDSWVGKGQNMPVSGDQLQQVLGPDMLNQLASQLGISSGEAGSQLSQLLPQIVDQLTPDGQAPSTGLGDPQQMLGMLSKLMGK